MSAFFKFQTSRSGKVSLGKAPVHQACEKGFHKLRASIAVVDVVGVLPNINRHLCFVSGSQRRASWAGIDNVY
mgnify:CR=1 FL=1